MSMLKTAIITCGLLFCLNLEIHGSELKSFTKQWHSNYTLSPNVVKVNGDLIIASVYNDKVYVNSTFDGNQSIICKPDFMKNNYFLDQTKVTALGNGKILIHTTLPTYEGGKDCFWHQFIIMDPFNCSTIRNMKLPRNKDYTFEALVPYHDSFDVFFHNASQDNVNKTPQRYNDQGEQLKLDNVIGLDNQYYIKNIETIEPYDASKGYISYMYAGNGSHVLRLLNSRFEISKEIVLEKPVKMLSATNGKINYCYSDLKKVTKEVGSEHVESDICKFLDADFNTTTTIELLKTGYLKSACDSAVTNLPDGGALVRVAYKDDCKTRTVPKMYPMKIYVQRINADGSKREPVGIFTPEIYFDRVMKTILMDNGDVCFVNSGVLQPVYTDFTVMNYSIWIDCVQVSNL